MYCDSLYTIKTDTTIKVIFEMSNRFKDVRGGCGILEYRLKDCTLLKERYEQ
jgi:hypothetical protein